MAFSRDLSDNEAAQAMTRIALPQIVEQLEAQIGQQKPPKLDGPWEMILWENVALPTTTSILDPQEADRHRSDADSLGYRRGASRSDPERHHGGTVRRKTS